MLENVRNLIEKEVQLENYDGEDKIITSYEMLKHLDATKRVSISLKSGIPTLDDCIGGFDGGELTVISGITGNGKTLLAQSLTHSFATQRMMSVWFSFEVQPRYFLNKFGSDLPRFTMPSRLKGNSMKWITDRIWEAKVKYDIRAVFLDHLHFIVDMSVRQNISLVIGSVMRELKTIALQHNIAIFLISHTSKVKIDRERKAGLELEDIRDSSFISQEADNVLLIWRATDVTNGALLKIAKDRKNGTFGKVIKLIKEGSFLRELTNV